MKKAKYYISTLAVLLPSIVFAEEKTLKTLIGTISGYLNDILALLMGFAVVVFVYYIIKYFIQPSDTKRTEAAQYLMWSLIGFFIILSLWGMVNILISTFDLGTPNPGTWTGLNSLFPN